MASVKAIEARGFSFRYPESTAGIGPLDWAVEERHGQRQDHAAR